MSVEKERRDERQIVKQVQRKGREEEGQRKTATDQMCALCVHAHQFSGCSVKNYTLICIMAVKSPMCASLVRTEREISTIRSR